MSYVYAAYLVTFVVVAFYVAYIVRRARSAAARLLALGNPAEPVGKEREGTR